jgi:phosphate-selective porin
VPLSRRLFPIAAGLSLLLATSAHAQNPAPPAGQAHTPAGAPDGLPTVALSGYFQAELDAGAPGDARFGPADRLFVRRAQLTVSGSAMPDVVYRLQVQLAGGLGTMSNVAGTLADGYVEWTKFRAAHVRFGQFKSPFGREYLGSSTQLLTVERTMVTDRLTLNRQIGLEVLGDVAGGRAGYSFAVVNGTGRNTTVNDNAAFMYIARGTVTPWQAGAPVHVEIGANAFWSRDTRLSMPVEFGLDSTPETPLPDGVFTGRRTGAGVDAHVERAVWRIDAELLRVRFNQAAPGVPAAVVSDGWYLQPAAFVRGRVVQVVGRYERYRPDTHVVGNTTSTWLGGVNYYPSGPAVKLLLDYLWVNAPATPDAHRKALAQVQVVF